MANTLKDAIRLASQNPDSPNSLKLKEAIIAGKMDGIAQQEGLNLSAFKQHFSTPRTSVQTQLQAGGTPNASTLIQTATELGSAGASNQKIQEEQGRQKAMMESGLSPEDIATYDKMNKGSAVDAAIGIAKTIPATLIGAKEAIIDPVRDVLAPNLAKEVAPTEQKVREAIAPTESQKAGFEVGNLAQWFIPFMETGKGASLLSKVISGTVKGEALGAGQSGSLTSPEAIGGAALGGAFPVAGSLIGKAVKGIKTSKTISGLVKEAKVPTAPIDITPVVEKAKTLGTNLPEALTTNYNQGLSDIAQKYGKQQFKNVVPESQAQIKNLLKKEGIDIGKDSIKFSPAWEDPSKQKIVERIAKVIDNRLPPTVENLNSIRLGLKGINDDAQSMGGSISAVSQKVYDNFRGLLGDSINEIKVLNKEYSAGKTIVDSAQGYLKSANEKKLLNLYKTGNINAQKAIKQAEDYARRIGIKHEGDILGESKSIIDKAKHEKMFKNITEDQIVSAAKDTGMEVDKFKEILQKALKGNKVAATGLATKIWKVAGPSILKGTGEAVGLGAIYGVWKAISGALD